MVQIRLAEYDGAASLSVSDLRHFSKSTDAPGLYLSISYGPVDLKVMLTNGELQQLKEAIRVSELPEAEAEVEYKRIRGY